MYLIIGYDSTSNTSVALTGCAMTNNAAGLCEARYLIIQVDGHMCENVMLVRPVT